MDEFQPGDWVEHKVSGQKAIALIATEEKLVVDGQDLKIPFLLVSTGIKKPVKLPAICFELVKNRRS